MKPTETTKAKQKPTKNKPKPDPRGERRRRLLRWLDHRGLPGYVAWAPVEHPDFPGKRVEVGGVDEAVAANPPVALLDAGPLTALLLHAAAERARLGFASAVAVELGGRLVRVTAGVANRGKLPTVSAMGRLAGKHQRLEIELQGPEGVTVLAGPLRQDLGLLQPGEVAERAWLIRLPPGATPADLRLRAGEPSVGFVESALSTGD